MTRWASLVVLAVTGLVCGVAVGLINTAFLPNCGDVCAAERLGKETLYGLMFLLAFPAIGQVLFKRTGGGFKQTIIFVGGLSFASLAPFVVMYGVELHQQYWKTAWRSNLPNVDMSMMAIATRPVSATVYGTTSKVPINAWERCAFGAATCGKHVRTVEAICLGSGATVLIDESSWLAFQRIPNEDLKGLRGQPQDMDLCAAR